MSRRHQNATDLTPEWPLDLDRVMRQMRLRSDKWPQGLLVLRDSLRACGIPVRLLARKMAQPDRPATSFLSVYALEFQGRLCSLGLAADWDAIGKEAEKHKRMTPGLLAFNGEPHGIKATVELRASHWYPGKVRAATQCVREGLTRRLELHTAPAVGPGRAPRL